MAGVAARVDAGDLEPRMEVPGLRIARSSVLADAFNKCSTASTGGFEDQREFIADASHELRTPITVIRGQLEVLAARRASEPRRRAPHRRHVQREITRMSRLIDDLLLLARPSTADFLRPEPIDLRAVRRPAVGRGQPDRRPPVRARRRSRPELLRADPTGSRRRCATSPATRSSTRCPTNGLVRLDVDGPRRDGSASP